MLVTSQPHTSFCAGMLSTQSLDRPCPCDRAGHISKLWTQIHLDSVERLLLTLSFKVQCAHAGAQRTVQCFTPSLVHRASLSTLHTAQGITHSLGRQTQPSTLCTASGIMHSPVHRMQPTASCTTRYMPHTLVNSV